MFKSFIHFNNELDRSFAHFHCRKWSKYGCKLTMRHIRIEFILKLIKYLKTIFIEICSILYNIFKYFQFIDISVLLSNMVELGYGARLSNIQIKVFSILEGRFHHKFNL